MTKNNIYAAIAVQKSGFSSMPLTSGDTPAKSLYNNIMTRDRPSKGETRRFGRAAFALPIILVLTLLPLAGAALYYVIEFGFRSNQDYRNFIIIPGLIVGIAGILIVVIVLIVRIRFAGKVRQLLHSGTKIKAKVIDAYQRTKYSPTTRSSGGPIVLNVIYEYQSAHDKTARVSVFFPLKEASYFFVDKELVIMASHDDKLNIMLKS